MISFPLTLHRFRLRAGLSQNALAKRARINPAYVNRMEHARETAPVLPSRKVVLRLADALEISGIEQDRLLIAAGLCPDIVRQMSERQLRAIYTLLGEDAIEPARLDVAS